MVALTFDSNMTDAMLAELARHQVASFDDRRVVDELVAERVPATFFLAGKWIQRYPEETRRIATDPLFEVGSHSYAHRAFHLPCYGLRETPGHFRRIHTCPPAQLAHRLVRHAGTGTWSGGAGQAGGRQGGDGIRR
jgi:hypothetical protein